MDPLPPDAFNEVLRRVPPCGLAACRCVCGAWRAAVDRLGLLAAHVLPHSLAGFFINLYGKEQSRFFARRSTSPLNNAMFGPFMPNWVLVEVWDHCDGLVLCHDTEGLYVCNPATRRAELLPPLSEDTRLYIDAPYLAFDPATSRHYDVTLFPQPRSYSDDEETETQRSLKRRKRHLLSAEDSTEWPPSLFKIPAFSSRTSRWEERKFVREGDAVVTLAQALSDKSCPPFRSYSWERARWRYGVYWKGALYVHCRGDFLTKLYLSHEKYKVIKMPTKIGEREYSNFYLGKSEKGVYYTTLDMDELRVWALDESSGSMQWILKYHADLKPLVWQINTLGSIINTPTWTMDFDCCDYEIFEDEYVVLDYNSEVNKILDDDNEEKYKNDENIEWNSDDDYTLDVEHNNMGNFESKLSLLGFHPYKEVVFLSISSSALVWRAVALRLRDSKAQCLGILWPSGLHIDGRVAGVHESFPYMPCLIDPVHVNWENAMNCCLVVLSIYYSFWWWCIWRGLQSSVFVGFCSRMIQEKSRICLSCMKRTPFSYFHAPFCQISVTCNCCTFSRRCIFFFVAL